MGNKHSAVSSSISLTPLYEACRDGNEEQVRSLLPRYSRADLNRQEYPYGGNTCLHVAAANGHDHIVKLLINQGCYRSAVLNSQNQSAYDLASCGKESTRLLFLRQSSSRFYEENAIQCFDIVKVEDNRSDGRRSSIKMYKIDEEQGSKAMCQPHFSRFSVNRFHSDKPIDHPTTLQRLNHMLQQGEINPSDDQMKIDDLMEQFQKNFDSIEQLLHLYTLETPFYNQLKEDPLPMAIPLFMNLPKLKKRFFRGRVYRSTHLSHQQLLTYQIAMETAGTLLQTNSFSSTSMSRNIAEGCVSIQPAETFPVLFIFDFPEICDQAINLSRISIDTPCLSEYESEEEVLILPWTFFEVTRIRKASNEDDFYTIHLTNVITPNKTLLSTLKWTCTDWKQHLIRDKKMKFYYAYQKYKH